jgi:OOP family OmpA-OmpF porin
MSRWVLSAVAFALVAAPSAAKAQGADVNINPFHHAMDSRGYLTLNSSQTLGNKEFSFGLVTDWGFKLLEFENGENTTSIDNIITPTLIAAAGLKLGPAELEFGVGLPFVVVAGNRDPDFVGDPGTPNDDMRFKIDGQGLGNVALHLKTRFLKTTRGPKVGLGVVGSLYLPTASEKAKFLGEDKLTPQVMGILEKELGAERRLRLAINGGVRIRTGTKEYTDNGDPNNPAAPMTGESFETGTEIPVGVAVAYAVTPQKFDVVGEIYGGIPLGGDNYFPLEAIGGIKVYLARNSFLTLGGGTGIMPGNVGSPKARGFIGIVFEPNIGDRDGDGLKDDVDDCPNDPEDYDDFEDEDGCPEPDNDKDGILDEDDKCPLNPGTRTTSRTRTAAPRVTRTIATATVCSTTSTSARTTPRTSTSSRTRTAAPTPTTTRTASSTSTICALTIPRTRTAGKTKTAVPIRTTTRTRSSTTTTAAPTSPRPRTASRTRTDVRIADASS